MTLVPSGVSYYLTVEVQNVIKGNKADTIKILQANDQHVASVGQRYVFFLKDYKAINGYYIAGGYQGIMNVENNAVRIDPTLNNNLTKLKNGRVPFDVLLNNLKK